MRAGCCVTKYSSTSFMASSPSYFFREIDVFRPWQCQTSPWMVVNQGYCFKPCATWVVVVMEESSQGFLHQQLVLWKDSASI